MNHRGRVAIDCDGVVLSWRRGFARHVQDEFGIALTDADFEQGDCLAYPSFAGLSSAEVDAVLDSYFRHGPAILEDRRIPEYWAWLESWTDPIIVTNRPTGCSTRQRLQELGIAARVINNVGAKAHWSLLADDWSQHCRSNEASGGRSILYRQPWSGEPYPTAATSWPELMSTMRALHGVEAP